MRKNRRSQISPPGADAGPDVSGDVFGMGAQVRRFRRTTFFVPDYAAHVPVAQRVLDGKLVSRQLHRLVRDVMTHRPGSMVHAGAFFGDMLTSFSRKTPGTVYAFEPVLENYLFAHSTLEANRLDNVLLFHAGLGAENSVVTIETENRHSGRHRGGAAYVIQADDPPPLRSQRVPLLSVDQFRIPDLSLIQLDVEGYETHVLHGARDSIARNRPVIVVEDKNDRCVDVLSASHYVEVRRIGDDRIYVPEEERDRLLPVVRRKKPADRE